ncbi:response regulator transcription factor [Mesorhizobium sp. Root157]|uniref:response regulator transcription factor n=1 Tax=Mesorhizobium sp. Root157 TaxID=1736477 RepID=UPI001FCD9655|nr:response regulator transcription factor [Mesorhizobium sp. Root157]
MNGKRAAVGAIESRKTVLFVTAPGAISGSLIYALDHEFPWLDVKQMDSVEAACVAFAFPVALILIDPGLLSTAQRMSAELTRRHPHAMIALIEPDSQNSALVFPDICESQLVRGVLPMNLRLDVWLSVVRLMLRGGEYFPVGMLQSYAHKIASAPQPALLYGENPAEKSARVDRVADLTPREMQILEMVSRGLQNKAIAAEFSLSEHTVKIHLHNIISKLGIHNRTEAAARYRDHQAGRIRITSANPG